MTATTDPEDAPALLPAAPAALGTLLPWLRTPQGASLQLLALLLLMVAGLGFSMTPITLAAALALAGTAGLILLPMLQRSLQHWLQSIQVLRALALLSLLLAVGAIGGQLGWFDGYLDLWRQRQWEAIGAIGEGVVGAFGQILVALVALIIAWQQVRVDLRLTGQQNRITQAQTIDNFIQGISDLIVDEEGLLEDWPLERMLAEGRLAAVLGSIDAEGKARVLRFLSHALLLSPLRRDQRLGRAILDGQGSYQVDRSAGVSVVRLQAMLRNADLRGCDLRTIDFHGADLRGADFSGSDLSEANLAGADLTGANLERCTLEGTRFFFGRPQTATPASITPEMDLLTGAGTGATILQASFRGARRLDPQQHYYLASWSGARSRASLPGGSRGIADQLQRHA